MEFVFNLEKKAAALLQFPILHVGVKDLSVELDWVGRAETTEDPVTAHWLDI